MPREVTVTLANGEQVQYKNVPDTVTPDQISERAQKEYGMQIESIDGGRKSPLAGVERGAKVAGSAIARGAIGVPAMIGDASSVIAENLPVIGPTLRFARKQLGLDERQGMGGMRETQKFGTQPETSGEKYASSILEAGTGAALTGGLGPANLAKNVFIGGSSGAAGELAGHLTDNNPLGRLAGALLGGLGAGGLAGLASRVRPQSAELAKEAMEGLTPEMLQRAAIVQNGARQQGVDMDLAQALEAIGAPSSNLKTMRDVLANSRHGDKVQKALNQQPQQFELLADRRVAGLPGPQWDPSTAANAVQEAATATVNAAKKARTNAVKDLYGAAGPLSADAKNQILAQIDQTLEKPGNTEALIRAATGFRQKLQGESSEEAKALAKALDNLALAPTARDRIKARIAVNEATAAMRNAERQPIHALDADAALSDVVAPFKGTPLSPVDPRSQGQVKQFAGQMNEALQQASPEIRRAEQLYGQISREVVDPLKQSVVGQMATRSGYRPDVQASVAKLESVFAKGSDAQTAEAVRDIPVLFNQLRKVDPDAVPAAAKAFIRGRLDKAFGSLPGDTLPNAVGSADAARKVQESLFATRAQWQGMRDIAAGLARTYDKDVTQTVRGLENFMQITRGLASRPGKVGGLNWEDVAKAGGKSAIADAARVYGFMPFERVARRIEDATLAKTFQEFDRVLTTPEGAELLIRLSKTPTMSNKAIAALAEFGALPSATAPDPEQGQ